MTDFLANFTGNEILFGLIVVAVLVWPLVMRLLAEAAGPSRQEMIDLGCKLVQSRHLDSRQKDLVSMMLGNACNWHFMASICFLVPFYIIGRKLNMVESTMIERISDKETEKDFSRFLVAHMRSVTAANPVFAALFFVIFTALVMFLLVCGQFYRIGDIFINSIAYSDQRLIRITSLWRS